MGKRGFGWTLNTQKPELFEKREKSSKTQKLKNISNFFLLLFPKDSKSLKIMDIRLPELGAKRLLNGTSKVNRRMDGQTDRQTYISTRRKHWPGGPML